MMKFESCELLDTAGNSAVVRRFDREFPGVLIQGDTLRCILYEVEELIEEANSGDLVSINEISVVLKEKLSDMLKHYEKTLIKHNIKIPYMTHVSEE